MDTARGIFGNRVHYGETPEASVRNANGLIVLTEWPEFKEIDLDSLVKWLATPLIIDGRGVFDGNRLSSMGVAYYSVGLSQ
jgi:UDPglucose 6-dehydrogenase